MCGIIGYSARNRIDNVFNVIIQSLKKLEYRGYDSAGIALFNENNIELFKQVGRVSELDKILKEDPRSLNITTSSDSQKNNSSLNIGIGHTRWATHGIVSNENAHPHFSFSEKVCLVHNGIIENYQELKGQLTSPINSDFNNQNKISSSITFKSQTDTEIIANLIEYNLYLYKKDVKKAICKSLQALKGQYTLLILLADFPGTLIAAKQKGPLLVGKKLNNNNSEFIISSDITPLIGNVDDIMHLEDEEICIINDNTINIYSIWNSDKPKALRFREIKIKEQNITKGKYEHFMLKEIYEQPKAIIDCLFDKVDLKKQSFIFKELEPVIKDLLEAKRIMFLACGSSLNSAFYAKYIIEDLCKIPVYVEQASEFRYRNPVIQKNDIFFFISQSGETADVIQALESVTKFKNQTISITNVQESTISRLSNINIYLNAGIEVGVASTKAFTNQLCTFIALALYISKKKKILPESKLFYFLDHLSTLAHNVEKVLNLNKEIEKIALMLSKYENTLFLGRNYSYIVALEGALKLKEVSYIHAEAYSAAEMKHGPLSLITDKMPVVFLACEKNNNLKSFSNIQEIKSRDGKLIIITSVANKNLYKTSNCVITLPDIDDIYLPILSTVAIQLLSYYVALYRGCDIDQPRNLAKSVTVE